MTREGMYHDLMKDVKVPRQKPSGHGRIDRDTVEGRIYKRLLLGKATGHELLTVGRTTNLGRAIHKVRRQLPKGQVIPPPEMIHRYGQSTISWYRLVRG